MSPAPPPPPAPPRPGSALPRTVIWFGVVSLCTDAAGDLIYPLLPLFLVSSLGAPLPWVGLIEGVAETTASLFKLVSGRIADRVPRKKPLVLFGYGLASAVRPLVALAHSPWTVLLVRFADRVGKGVRSSPRDAMVAEATHRTQRGAAYGYHRAMDNLGAVLGPLTGFALLRYGHVELRTIFALAAVPGLLAMLALILGVVEAPAAAAPADAAAHKPDAAAQGGPAAVHKSGVAPAAPDAAPQYPASPPSAAPASPPPGASSVEAGDPRALALYLGCVALFTLGNSADAFLLVRAAQVLHPGEAVGGAMLADPTILLLWCLHNAVKAALSRSLGGLSDRYGRRPLIAAGWLLYAVTYLWFAVAGQAWEMWALFAIYGLYYALVEGPERALVAELAGPGRKGTAFGWFHAIVGLASLPASLGFGLLYRAYGPLAAFGASAALAALAAAMLGLVQVHERQAAPTPPAPPRPA